MLREPEKCSRVACLVSWECVSFCSHFFRDTFAEGAIQWLVLLGLLCFCFPSAGVDHSPRTVQSHFARCRQGATGHPGNPQWSLKDCPDIPCQHGRNESLHYHHTTWDQWQMGTCEFFPTLQVSVGRCHCSVAGAPESELFTLQLLSYAYCWAFFFVVCFWLNCHMLGKWKRSFI